MVTTCTTASGIIVRGFGFLYVPGVGDLELQHQVPLGVGRVVQHPVLALPPRLHPVDLHRQAANLLPVPLLGALGRPHHRVERLVRRVLHLPALRRLARGRPARLVDVHLELLGAHLVGRALRPRALQLAPERGLRGDEGVDGLLLVQHVVLQVLDLGLRLAQLAVALRRVLLLLGSGGTA